MADSSGGPEDRGDIKVGVSTWKRGGNISDVINCELVSEDLFAVRSIAISSIRVIALL